MGILVKQADTRKKHIENRGIYKLDPCFGIILFYAFTGFPLKKLVVKYRLIFLGPTNGTLVSRVRGVARFFIEGGAPKISESIFAKVKP